MILIGASGSTKCDWQLVKDEKPFIREISKGLNPFFLDDETIASTVSSLDKIVAYKDEIEVVYFFGAGCSSKHFCTMVERGLSRIFNKSHLYIKEDIVGAAFATYDGETSITALMGTGSNACSFDGDIVRQEVSGIDFILGDEGSRSNLGKQLLRAYLQRKLPDHIAKDLEDNFNVSKQEILLNVYIKPYANVYLSTFSKFIHERIDEPFLTDLVNTSIAEFIDLYICSFNHYDTYKTNFVGSIPHYFRKQVESIAVEKGLQLGLFIEKPIDKLVNYLIKKHYGVKA